MEPRAAIGEYDRATGDYTLYTTSQDPHVIRLLIAASVLSVAEHKFRVVAPDVGGGFGTKGSLFAEQAMVTWAAGIRIRSNRSRRPDRGHRRPRPLVSARWVIAISGAKVHEPDAV
jgi:xanthine dehydrogenase molybdopterin-binding subunit B